MQGTIEWLKERQKGIGSSDVAAILGLIPQWKTPLDVYIEKTSPEPIQSLENRKMTVGKKIESFIAKLFCDETGYKVMKRNDIVWHKEIPYLFASLDRVIQKPPDKNTSGVLEIKNTTSQTADKWEDGISDYYMVQIQHQLDVTGYEWGYFAVLVDGWDLRNIPVYPDKELIEIKNERLAKFWKDHVEKRIPPEPITEKDIKTLYPKTNPNEVIEITDENYNKLIELKLIKEKIKELEQKQEDLELQIKLLLQDKEILTYKGNIVLTWKQYDPVERFDSKSFKEKYPDLYKEFIKIGEPQRKFISKIK